MGYFYYSRFKSFKQEYNTSKRECIHFKGTFFQTHSYFIFLNVTAEYAKRSALKPYIDIYISFIRYNVALEWATKFYGELSIFRFTHIQDLCEPFLKGELSGMMICPIRDQQYNVDRENNEMSDLLRENYYHIS